MVAFDFSTLDVKTLKSDAASVRSALQMVAVMGGAVSPDDKARLEALEAELKRRRVAPTPAKGPDPFGTRG